MKKANATNIQHIVKAGENNSKKTVLCCTTYMINTYICIVLQQQDIIDRLN